MSSTAPLLPRDLGLVDYEDGLRAQEVVADGVRAGTICEQLLLLSHPAVVTLGRQGRREALLVAPQLLEARGVDLFRTDRGGDATYHDPGQLVGYPILRLADVPAAPGLAAGHSASLVWNVEQLLIEALATLGVAAGREQGLPGIWHQGRKVAALGMRIDRGVTRHGFALNLSTSPAAWQVIVPCGLADKGVISLEQIAGGPLDRRRVIDALLEAAARVLGRRVQPPLAPERRSVQVVLVRRTDPPQVLVLHRIPARGGFWQPITGMVEPGEAPAEAAAREVLEETGLRPSTLEALDYVHSFLVEPGLRDERFAEVPSFLQEHSFVAALEPAAAAEVTVAPREHDEAAWLPVEQAVQRMRWSGNRRAIRLAVSRSAPSGLG